MASHSAGKCNSEIIIVGAGMTGLTAADQLRRTGFDRVTVVEKGRGVGGRMASRRIGSARCDHGAQFITARDPRFAAKVREWEQAGVLTEWYRSYPGVTGGHPRWRGNPGMTAPAKAFAGNLDVHLSTKVSAVVRKGACWRIGLEDGPPLHADAVLLTPPVPQSLDLLRAGNALPGADLLAQLEKIEYHKCIAAMAVLDGPSLVPEPGGVMPPLSDVDWIADNHRKGISPISSVTVHGSAAFSSANWGADRRSAGAELLRSVRDYLGAEVVEMQVHGWRYSKPGKVHSETCLVLDESPPLLIAGDAFGGPRVEGAARSGWAAAKWMIHGIGSA